MYTKWQSSELFKFLIHRTIFFGYDQATALQLLHWFEELPLATKLQAIPFKKEIVKATWSKC